ncbi:MAG TPA: 5-dehydro-2-deoxygluconokinase [Actinopolymorphaceae bacterium]|nr:5-dehydro-2-deoxygluconokinase [Actinopolymorphaceae bacterium]
MSDDVLTMGRVSVDLYPDDIGVRLPDVRSFHKFLGGSATNVAVAAARHGRRSAVITRTGADPFGDYIHQALRRFGVDDRFVTPVSGLPTPVVFCEIFPPDDFPLYFYRYPKAPDLEIHESELDFDAIAAARIFWVTGTGLSEEPSRSSTLAALRAREHRPFTVLDLDYRPMFWHSDDVLTPAGSAGGPRPQPGARAVIGGAVEHATVAVGNLDECEIAVGTRDPDKAASALLDRGVELAVVKQGPAGVLARTADAEVVVPPVPVDVVNGLGAGDAFGGALCHGLLAGWELDRVLRFANAAGAYVAARLACADAMPDEAEVEALLRETAHG